MNGITVSKKIILSFALLIVMFLGFGAFACYSGQKLHETVVDLVGWTDNLAAVANVADAASAESPSSAPWQRIPQSARRSTIHWQA